MTICFHPTAVLAAIFTGSVLIQDYDVIIYLRNLLDLAVFYRFPLKIWNTFGILCLPHNNVHFVSLTMPLQCCHLQLLHIWSGFFPVSMSWGTAGHVRVTPLQTLRRWLTAYSRKLYSMYRFTTSRCPRSGIYYVMVAEAFQTSLLIILISLLVFLMLHFLVQHCATNWFKRFML